MSPKWFIFLITIWIVLALLGGVVEGAYLGAQEAGTLNTIMNAPVFVGEGNLFIRAAQTFFDKGIWMSLVKMALFDFAMFSGSMAIFKWLIFIPLAAGILISLTLAVFRGVSSG